MMKKATVIVLVCILALTMLAACGGNNTGNQGTEPPADNNPPAGNNSSTDNNPPANNDPAGFDADRIIAVFTREDGSGTRDAFVNITGVGDDMYIEAVVQNETAQILTSVETNDTGIGYVSVGSLSDAVKALPIDGVLPSDETIIDGTYSLQRPFLVCVTDEKKNDPLVQDFLDFMLSSEGQALSATRWTSALGRDVMYEPSGLTGTLKVGGSTSVEPLMQQMREAYLAHNPGVEIEISGGGSGAGINEATEGIIDIGMSSRGLRDNEKDALTDIVIALDGVAIIVNKANPVEGMTMEQVKDIFIGDITRWSNLS